MLPGPKSVEEPHKELRFTRSRQAAQLAVSGILLCLAAIAILLCGLLPDTPLLSWWWALLPLPFAVFLFRLSYHCVRHAYVILTPLGIEIFPFVNAREGLQVVYWTEVAEAEVNGRDQLVIHHDEAQTSGVVVSLLPIPPDRRQLLRRAIEGRMRERPVSGEVSPIGD